MQLRVTTTAQGHVLSPGSRAQPGRPQLPRTRPAPPPHAAGWLAVRTDSKPEPKALAGPPPGPPQVSPHLPVPYTAGGFATPPRCDSASRGGRLPGPRPSLLRTRPDAGSSPASRDGGRVRARARRVRHRCPGGSELGAACSRPVLSLLRRSRRLASPGLVPLSCGRVGRWLERQGRPRALEAAQSTGPSARRCRRVFARGRHRAYTPSPPTRVGGASASSPFCPREAGQPTERPRTWPCWATFAGRLGRAGTSSLAPRPPAPRDLRVGTGLADERAPLPTSLCPMVVQLRACCTERRRPKSRGVGWDPSFQASLAQAPGGLRRGGRGSGGRVGVHRAGAGPVLRVGSALASWFRFFSSLGSGHGAAAPRVGTDPAPACDSVLCACGGPRGPRAFAHTASGGVEVEGTGGGRGRSWPRVPLSPGAHGAGLTAELGMAPRPPPTIREAHVTPASPRPRFSAVYPHRGGPATS